MKHRNNLLPASMLLIILLFTAACHNTPQKKNIQKPVSVSVDVKSGEVMPHIPCSADTSESYALYLPSDYSPKHLFPVIFFFDAHARGALVVKKYKSIAEEFGFILAASNNSKNGQSQQQTSRVLYHFMQDVEQRFSVDPQRIYTAGFSGGARVAAAIGLFNKSVAGTIGLEAGFPPVRQIPDTHLTWVGVVGNTDFNYLEMKDLSRRLDAMGMQNLLLVYPGKHELPPARMFKKAYEFLLLDAMRKQIVPLNQSIIDTVKNRYDRLRIQAQKGDHCLQQLEADQALVKNLEGLTNVTLYQNEIKKLSASHACQLRKKEMTALLQTETFDQQKFDQSLSSEGSGWWRHQIQELYRKKSVARDEQVKLMDQRLLNYLSLMSYLYAGSSLQNRQMEETEKFLMIYQMVDPDNPEVYLMKAEFEALQNQNNKALTSLQKAVDHGFKDTYRIENNNYFKNLKALPEFTKILGKIKKVKN
ncbi:MAG: hypothetical protein JXR71_06600 [Bacteroidales bacterium]|nr:hypothetical protein [Bacteroidales bacterium]